MGLLDKILFTADYIEARRDKADNLAQMRRWLLWIWTKPSIRF